MKMMQVKAPLAQHMAHSKHSAGVNSWGGVELFAPRAFPAVTAAPQPGVCLLGPLRNREHLAFLGPQRESQEGGGGGLLRPRGRAQGPSWD